MPHPYKDEVKLKLNKWWWNAVELYHSNVKVKLYIKRNLNNVNKVILKGSYHVGKTFDMLKLTVW